MTASIYEYPLSEMAVDDAIEILAGVLAFYEEGLSDDDIRFTDGHGSLAVDIEVVSDLKRRCYVKNAKTIVHDEMVVFDAANFVVQRLVRPDPRFYMQHLLYIAAEYLIACARAPAAYGLAREAASCVRRITAPMVPAKAMYVSDYAGAQLRDAIRITVLAHEFGHLLVHGRTDWGQRSHRELELECDKYAVEVLAEATMFQGFPEAFNNFDIITCVVFRVPVLLKLTQLGSPGFSLEKYYEQRAFAAERVMHAVSRLNLEQEWRNSTKNRQIIEDALARKPKTDLWALIHAFDCVEKFLIDFAGEHEAEWRRIKVPRSRMDVVGTIFDLHDLFEVEAARAGRGFL